jgi:hypothetical protein
MRPEKFRILTIGDLFEDAKTTAVGLTAEQARALMDQMQADMKLQKEVNKVPRVTTASVSARARARMKAARAEKLASCKQVPPPTPEQLGAVLTVSRPRMT